MTGESMTKELRTIIVINKISFGVVYETYFYFRYILKMGMLVLFLLKYFT